MRKTYPFDWLDDSPLIIVHVEINEETTLRFLLDTGSSDTYLDKNILYIEQINLKEAIEQVEVETANGWMLADVFLIDSIKAFGFKQSNIFFIKPSIGLLKCALTKSLLTNNNCAVILLQSSCNKF